MIRKEKLHEISRNLSSGNSFMQNLRRNLYMYVSDSEITIRDIAESAGIPLSTLNSLLYGDAQDCKGSTLIALAKALNVSIDELTGAGTMPEPIPEAINICRSLPEHARHAIMWYIRHQQAVCHAQPKGSHIISVMHPRINNNGNLKVSGAYTAVDISGVPKEVCRKIFWGVQLDVDFYMPKFSPYDILLIANDRTPTAAETALIILDDNIFLAKRHIVSSVPKYYSIRDGKFRVDESECDEVIGYIAYVIQDSGFAVEGW